MKKVKKNKKVLFVALFLSIFAFIGCLVPFGSVFARTFTYNANLSTDSSSLGDYAIDSISYSNFLLQYTFVYEFTGNQVRWDTSQNNCCILYGYTNSSTAVGFTNKRAFNIHFSGNNSWPDVLTLNRPYLRNIKVTCSGDYLTNYSDSSSWWFCLMSNSSSVTYRLEFTYDFKISLAQDNLNACVDMLSTSNNINFSFSNMTNLFTACYNNCLNSTHYSDTEYPNSNFNSLVSSVTFAYSNNNTSVSGSSSHNVSSLRSLGVAWNSLNSNTFTKKCDYLSCGNLSFNINRPTARINNTLIIYNYNYGILSDSLVTQYRLSKNSDYYNVLYNGTINNSTFCYIFNDDVQNIIFDSYIYTIFVGSFDYYEIASNYNEFSYHVAPAYSEIRSFWNRGSNYNFSFDLGFDFNFVYYTQPLVANNGSYNYTYTKPGYVDTPSIITNPGGWALAVAENVMIFFLFYCPIISNVISFIHFDMFFGAVLSIVNYILGLQIGQFIFSCIAFILFFVFVRSFMPILFSSGVNSYNNFISYETKKSKVAVEKNKKQQIYNDFKKEFNKKHYKYKK